MAWTVNCPITHNYIVCIFLLTGTVVCPFSQSYSYLQELMSAHYIAIYIHLHIILSSIYCDQPPLHTPSYIFCHGNSSYCSILSLYIHLFPRRNTYQCLIARYLAKKQISYRKADQDWMVDFLPQIGKRK